MMIALALTLALQSTAPTDWLVDDSTSALDGKRTLLVGRESEAPIINVVGQREKAMIALTCANSQRKIALQWPAFLGRDQVVVEWKVGEGEIQRTNFRLMSGTSAQITGRDADAMMAAFRAEQPLVVRVHARRNAQEATFSLVGASQHLDTVENACPSRRS